MFCNSMLLLFSWHIQDVICQTSCNLVHKEKYWITLNSSLLLNCYFTKLAEICLIQGHVVSIMNDKIIWSSSHWPELNLKWQIYILRPFGWINIQLTQYNYETDGDSKVLDCPQTPDEEHHPILREAAVKSLKMGKWAGVDNIPAELVQAGREVMIDILTSICNKIWQTGEWPTTWTQSLVITLPKKGNMQLCQNYRTISLISHCSKVMLKIILNRLEPQAEETIAEEQAEQIFDLRILCATYLQHQQNLYHSLHTLQEGLWQGMVRSLMDNYEEI